MFTSEGDEEERWEWTCRFEYFKGENEPQGENLFLFLIWHVDLFKTSSFLPLRWWRRSAYRKSEEKRNFCRAHRFSFSLVFFSFCFLPSNCVALLCHSFSFSHLWLSNYHTHTYAMAILRCIVRASLTCHVIKQRTACLSKEILGSIGRDCGEEEEEKGQRKLVRTDLELSLTAPS